MENDKLIELVKSAQIGDVEALNRLFDAYYNDLYYFALKTVKDSDLASDITQDAFIDIINGIATLKEPGAFVAWAKKVTYFQCTRHFKKKKDVIVDQDEDGNTVFDDLKEENSEFIPDEALERDDFKKTIMSIVDGLSEEQRATVMMYYFDELSIKEIAEIQGVSEGTVKSRLNYARKAIKQAVEDYEKKNNIKLHAFPFFPFMHFLFSGEKKNARISKTSFSKLAEGLGKGNITSNAVENVTESAAKKAARIGAKKTGKSVANKIVAAAVATAVGVGAICGVDWAVKNHNDNKDASSQSQAVSNDIISEKEEAFDSFAPLRSETIKTIKNEKPYELVEATVIQTARQYYKISREKYNILNHKEKNMLEDSRIFTEEGKGRAPDEIGFVVQYKIPCKDREKAIKLMKQDIEKANEIMREVYNGNGIDSDYRPELSEDDYKDASKGTYMIGFSVSETVGKGINAYVSNSIDFNLTCKEENDKLYYYPKIIMRFVDTEDTGEWRAGAKKLLTLMSY